MVYSRIYSLGIVCCLCINYLQGWQSEEETEVKYIIPVLILLLSGCFTYEPDRKVYKKGDTFQVRIPEQCLERGVKKYGKQ